MKLVCISCPRGCEMTVTIKNDEVSVAGNRCKRGEAYAHAEMTCPMRTLTSSIFVDGGDYPLLSVRTREPIPKSKLAEGLEVLRHLRAQAPINIGDTVLKNFVGTGIDLVATRKVQKAI